MYKRQRVARYNFDELNGQVDLGMNMGTRAQLRAGAWSGWIDAEQDTGIQLIPDVGRQQESTAFLSGTWDTRDNIRLPTRGVYANARYANSGSWFGGEQNYSIAEGVFALAFPLRGDALNLFGGAGSRLSGVLPAIRDFRLGGLQSFPGLRLTELRGTSYWVGGGAYRWKVADILSLFTQALYGGLRLQAGRIGGSRDATSQGTLYGISGNVGGATPTLPEMP